MRRHTMLSLVVIILFSVSILFISSCAHKKDIRYSLVERTLPMSEDKSDFAGAAQARDAAAQKAFAQNNTETTKSWSRKQIVTANVVLESKDVTIITKEAIKIAALAGGYSSGSTYEDDGYGGHISKLTVRIPAARFQATYDKIKNLAKLKAESTTAEDVTEEYVDVTSRIKNLKRTEERMLDVLQKANSVEDILKVEEQLNRVRDEIETLSGRKQYLDNATSLCTLNIEVRPPQQITITRPEQWNVSDTVKSAAAAMIAVCRGLLTIAIYIVVFIPVLVIFYIIIFAIKRIFQKRRNRA